MASSDTTADTAPSTEETKPVGPYAEYIELAKTVIYALLIALVLRVVLFQPYTIPSASMEPALTQGDYIIVSKFSYGWSKHSIPFSPPLFKGRVFAHEPKRGDVIVFKFPADMTKDFIKRLIGMPGDKVQVKRGVVFINGAAIQESSLAPAYTESAWEFPRNLDRAATTIGKHKFVTYSASRDSQAENTDTFTIPQGCYFMMGDNRDNSLDSRFASGTSACASDAVQPFVSSGGEPGVGFVPAEDLIGKAEIVMLSWKPGASLFKPWTWLNLNWGRFFRPIP